MTLYSIFEKPAVKGGSTEAPAAVAERFSWFAFLMTPLYALRHGLVLLFLFWVGLVLGLGFAASYLGSDAASGIYCLVALFLGFEAPALRRDALLARGWIWRGDLIATGEDIAQHEFLNLMAMTERK